MVIGNVFQGRRHAAGKGRLKGRLSSSLRLFFRTLPAEQQEKKQDACHGEKKEVIASRQDEAEGGNKQSGQRREMIAGSLPLLQEDDEEKCCHGKIDACGINGDDISGQDACKRTDNPVALVQQGGEEQEIFTIHTLRRRCGAFQGVGFIGQGKDHVGLQLSHDFKRLQHGKAVEKMAGVYHERDQGGGKRRKGNGQQLNCNKLHGACINKYTHKKGPAIGNLRVVQQYAEGHSQEKISHHDGKRIGNGGFQRFSFHGSDTSAIGPYGFTADTKKQQLYGNYF